MMNSEEHLLDLVRQEIVNNNLQVKAIIQDIQNCTESTELLNELNAKGRAKIAALRSSIERLESLAFQERSDKRKLEIYSEIESHKSQLTITLAAFRNANVVSACVIDRMAKDELLGMPDGHQSALRKRRDKQALINMSGGVTDKLLGISRHLAETTQKSAYTLDTLITSSEKVTGTKDELEHQQQVIVQSGKLLGKYGRRELTDKALLVLAFAFFLACVFYILQKRLL
ncbi:vesicle transport protein SEC20 [Neodiprion pinetum]|uniref:Vesicle transport protein SEC20 n=1 Tax=Neodiprion lecontei TaxID=441921 RepID=A0A6J0B9J0_NEOLC|nr:vesicle transport protein SEC20 [Neodiprion lecontei]XP_046412991.1 vesicle transport protein SEC20 [Neodiprion fabricii]XP_046467415.1 vesicle transport protein SEC20 [Neodiprion pinetum]XP_046627860.1 vesicle transport protein SEC20 [Neodiprion virginianus]